MTLLPQCSSTYLQFASHRIRNSYLVNTDGLYSKKVIPTPQFTIPIRLGPEIGIPIPHQLNSIRKILRPLVILSHAGQLKLLGNHDFGVRWGNFIFAEKSCRIGWSNVKIQQPYVDELVLWPQGERNGLWAGHRRKLVACHIQTSMICLLNARADSVTIMTTRIGETYKFTI